MPRIDEPNYRPPRVDQRDVDAIRRAPAVARQMAHLDAALDRLRAQAQGAPPALLDRVTRAAFAVVAARQAADQYMAAVRDSIAQARRARKLTPADESMIRDNGLAGLGAVPLLLPVALAALLAATAVGVYTVHRLTAERQAAAAAILNESAAALDAWKRAADEEIRRAGGGFEPGERSSPEDVPMFPGDSPPRPAPSRPIVLPNLPTNPNRPRGIGEQIGAAASGVLWIGAAAAVVWFAWKNRRSPRRG